MGNTMAKDNYTYNWTETELNVLTNFAQINKQMILQPNRFEVVNDSNSCVAFFEFDSEYKYNPTAVYEISELLGIIKQFGYTDVEIEDTNEKFFNIVKKSNNSKVKYYKTDSQIIPEVPSSIRDAFNQAEVRLQFFLSGEKLAEIKQMSKILHSEFIFFETVEVDGKTHLKATLATELDSSSNNEFVIPLDEDVKLNELTDVVRISIDELFLYQGDYTVTISTLDGSWISHWKSDLFKNLEYFIGCSIVE